MEAQAEERKEVKTVKRQPPKRDCFAYIASTNEDGKTHHHCMALTPPNKAKTYIHCMRCGYKCPFYKPKEQWEAELKKYNGTTNLETILNDYIMDYTATHWS